MIFINPFALLKNEREIFLIHEKSCTTLQLKLTNKTLISFQRQWGIEIGHVDACVKWYVTKNFQIYFPNLAFQELSTKCIITHISQMERLWSVIQHEANWSPTSGSCSPIRPAVLSQSLPRA